MTCPFSMLCHAKPPARRSAGHFLPCAVQLLEKCSVAGLKGRESHSRRPCASERATKPSAPIRPSRQIQRRPTREGKRRALWRDKKGGLSIRLRPGEPWARRAPWEHQGLSGRRERREPRARGPGWKPRTRILRTALRKSGSHAHTWGRKRCWHLPLLV